MKRSSSFGSFGSLESTASSTPSSPLAQFTPHRADKKPKIAEISPGSKPITSKTMNKTPSPAASKGKNKKSASSPAIAGSASPGTWSGEKRAAFLDEIIAVGYKGSDLDAIAAKLDLSKRQLIDQLTPNRSNMRAKAVKAVKGE